MPAVRIVLGHIFPALFGSNFQTGRVRAQETPNSDVTALQPGTQMSSATAGDLELNLSKQRASSERSDSPSKEQPSETYLVEWSVKCWNATDYRVAEYLDINKYKHVEITYVGLLT